MSRGLGMSGGMAVRRAITAKGNAAFLTRPQMYPHSSGLDALSAFQTRRMLDRSNAFDMSTTYVSHILPSGCCLVGLRLARRQKMAEKATGQEEDHPGHTGYRRV